MATTKGSTTSKVYLIQVYGEETPREVTAARMKFEPGASRVTLFDADDEVVAVFNNPQSAVEKQS